MSCYVLEVFNIEETAHEAGTIITSSLQVRMLDNHEASK